MRRSSGPRHPGQREVQVRCRAHGLTQDHFIPQLQRLLSTGAARDRRVYYSLIDDVVGTAKPLDLFDRTKQRPGVYLIEALYLTEAERVHGCEIDPQPLLAPLGYSRWVAWRQFREALRTGSIGYGRGVAGYVDRARQEVVQHLVAGWRPAARPGDRELADLIARL